MLSSYIKNHQRCLEAINSEFFLTLWTQALDVMLVTLRSNGKLLIAGNGGSAADAQHFAAELVGRFLLERKGYGAIALTTDTSAITSIGNDYGFDKIFSRQLEAIGKAQDCFIGITTSGNSENILEALKKAKELGMKTIVLTGKDGGASVNFADVAIVIPEQATAHIQEAHLVVYHAWCMSIEETLYGNK